MSQRVPLVPGGVRGGRQRSAPDARPRGRHRHRGAPAMKAQPMKSAATKKARRRCSRWRWSRAIAALVWRAMRARGRQGVGARRCAADDVHRHPEVRGEDSPGAIDGVDRAVGRQRPADRRPGHQRRRTSPRAMSSSSSITTPQQRTLETKRSELKQAESEIEKAEAEQRRRVQAAESELDEAEQALKRRASSFRATSCARAGRGREVQLAVSTPKRTSASSRQKIEGERDRGAGRRRDRSAEARQGAVRREETERIIASLHDTRADRRVDLADAELPRRRARAEPLRNSGAATAPGSARRSPSCPTSRRCSMTAASTKPIAAACQTGSAGPGAGRRRIGPRDDRHDQGHLRSSPSPISQRFRRLATSTSSSR